MVLSNKKLKQKLREDFVKSLSSATTTETNPDSSVSNLQSQSLKNLIDSASHKPRLSKREKRRNLETFDKPNEGIKEADNGGTNQKKKRKRDDDDTVEKVLDEEVEESTKEEEKPVKKKKKRDDDDDTVEKVSVKVEEGTKEEEKSVKKKAKKKKKKKKRKKSKTPKKAEEDIVQEKKVKEEEEIQVDTESKEEEDGIVPKKLYVGGIPYHSTEDDIRSYFRTCGVITKVDCKIRPDDGSFSGIAFITFDTEDGANRALALDRAAMGDLYLTIQQYVKTTPSVPRQRTSSGFVPEMVDGYNRVYVGNLAWDTTERDIRKLFSDCVINSVRLGKNKETGEFKGYAHVDFKDNVSVAMALKLDQHVISGRPVKICCALKERPVSVDSTNPTLDETKNVEDTYAAADVPNEVSNGNYFGSVVSSSKLKRKSCYECGEKGHLSTDCPKKLQNVDDQANTKLDQEAVTARPSYGFQNDNGGYYNNETYAATNEDLSSAVSGKIKRRSCYECGEKGHLSTACPKKLQGDQANTKPDQESVFARPAIPSYEQNNGGGSYTHAATNEDNSEGLVSALSSGKIKRRSCYDCGEKGHLSTACPKKLQGDQANIKPEQEAVFERPAMVSYDLQQNNGYTTTNEDNSEGLASALSSGKIKRRSCYECGEKGHLSTACPKKLQNTSHQQTLEAEPVQETSTEITNGGSYTAETCASTPPTSIAATDDGKPASAVSIGKIKRRKCHECGEKGHLSSTCPKKHKY